MPKARLTCTRCSQRRQKCDKGTPCSRCVKNGESHLCTTEWKEGYNPTVHRKYPRKPPSTQQDSVQVLDPGNGPGITPPQPGVVWPNTPISMQEMPTHFRSQGQPNPLPANSIDFVTFGRSEYSDISIGSLLDSKDSHLQNKNMPQNQGHFSANKQADIDGLSGGFSPHARAVEVFNIQSMLPKKELVETMVDYHELYMYVHPNCALVRLYLACG